MRGAFTPQSAAGGIGPCLSTGEPGAAAATRRSTPAWPSRHRVPLPRCPRATACQHFRRGWNQRSTSSLARASACQHSRRGWNQRSNSPSPRHSRGGCATVCQQFSSLHERSNSRRRSRPNGRRPDARLRRRSCACVRRCSRRENRMRTRGAVEEWRTGLQRQRLVHPCWFGMTSHSLRAAYLALKTPAAGFIEPSASMMSRASSQSPPLNPNSLRASRRTG